MTREWMEPGCIINIIASNAKQRLFLSLFRDNKTPNIAGGCSNSTPLLSLPIDLVLARNCRTTIAMGGERDN